MHVHEDVHEEVSPGRPEDVYVHVHEDGHVHEWLPFFGPLRGFAKKHGPPSRQGASEFVMSLESTIAELMTPIPYTVGRDVTIAEATEKMQAHGIRHLPVLHGGKLVGLVSDRDAGLIGALNDVDPTKVTVEEAMSNPWTVQDGAQISDVVREMTEHKYGSALVVDAKGNLVGIFTTHDALQALSELLEAARLAAS